MLVDLQGAYDIFNSCMHHVSSCYSYYFLQHDYIPEERVFGRRVSELYCLSIRAAYTVKCAEELLQGGGLTSFGCGYKHID